MKKFFSLFLTFAMMLSMSILAVAEEPVNVALGKNITPDGEYTNAGAYNNMTDGDVNTMGALIGGDPAVEFSLTMDLEKVYSISRIELVARAGDSAAYDLDAVTVSGVTEAGALEEICTTPPRWENKITGGQVWGYDLPQTKNYRYLKLSGASIAAFACAEWRAFGTEASTEPPVTETTNVAQGKQLTPDADYTLIDSLDKLIDGDISTRGGIKQTPGVDYEYGMTIDLEKTYSISRVELVCHEWGTNWNMYAITVSGVTESGDVEEICISPAHWTGEITAGTVWGFDLPATKNYRKLRLSGVCLGAVSDLFFAEFRAFGTEPSTEPPVTEVTNVSQGKVATVAGEYQNHGCTIDRMTDGDTNTFAAIASLTADPFEFNAVLDLEKLYSVSKIEVTARAAASGFAASDLSNMAISGGKTLDSMEPICNTPGSWEVNAMKAGETWTFELPKEKNYQFISISGSVDDVYMFACAEFSVFGKEPSTEPPIEEDSNVALNKDMSWEGDLDFLSNLEAFGPAKLVDGDNTTFTAFAGKAGGTPFELRVDLGDYYDISKIELEARSNMDSGWEVGSVTISGSTTEKPAAQMTALTATPSGYPPETALKPGEIYTHTLTKSQRFRYITLSGTTPDGFMFACAELRVFGKKANVPEVTDVNIAVGKPVTYTDGLKFFNEENGGGYGYANLNDGNDATAAMALAPASETYFYKIDLLNFYDICALEMPSRTKDQGWQAYDLGNITVLGSVANLPVDQMETIASTPSARDENGVPEGTTWRYDLPTAKKYRYIALKITAPVDFPSFIKELRVFSKAETDFGQWNITEKESGTTAETIEAGKTYSASISITNYARLETSDFVMILAGYDADGFMTAVRCAKTPVPDVGTSGPLSAEITLPTGTVRFSAVLVDGFNNAMMVVDSKDLFAAEGAE